MHSIIIAIVVIRIIIIIAIKLMDNNLIKFTNWRLLSDGDANGENSYVPSTREHRFHGALKLSLAVTGAKCKFYCSHHRHHRTIITITIEHHQAPKTDNNAWCGTWKYNFRKTKPPNVSHNNILLPLAYSTLQSMCIVLGSSVLGWVCACNRKLNHFPENH